MPCLIGLALRLQLGVTDDLADHCLELPFDDFRRSGDAILVHILSLCSRGTSRQTAPRTFEPGVVVGPLNRSAATERRHALPGSSGTAAVPIEPAVVPIGAPAVVGMVDKHRPGKRSNARADDGTHDRIGGDATNRRADDTATDGALRVVHAPRPRIEIAARAIEILFIFGLLLGQCECAAPAMCFSSIDGTQMLQRRQKTSAQSTLSRMSGSQTSRLTSSAANHSAGLGVTQNATLENRAPAGSETTYEPDFQAGSATGRLVAPAADRSLPSGGDRQSGERGKRLGAGSLHDFGAMVLDGPLADAEIGGNILAGLAGENQVHDLPLSRRKPGDMLRRFLVPGGQLGGVPRVVQSALDAGKQFACRRSASR